MRNFCFSLALLLFACTSLWAAPVSIIGGTASPADASAGEEVTITANAAPSGQRFAKWITTGVTVTAQGSASTTFTVPEGDYSIEALYCDQDLLAYEGFDVEMGVNNVIPLHQADSKSSFGWGNSWQVQNSNINLPGFDIANITPLQYEGLFSSKTYARGGRDYVDALRVLDRSAEGPFSDYIADESDKIGSQAGGTLWFSALVRKDQNDANEFFRFFNGTNTGGTGGACLKVKIQDSKFALSIKDGSDEQYYASSKEAVVGETYLIVLKMEFGTPNKISLFVNPTLGTEPTNPDATGETSSSELPFACLGWYPHHNEQRASFDEVRFGKTYAAVTPAPPTYNDKVTDITISNSEGKTSIPRGSKIAMQATVAPATANPEVIWSVEAGTGNAVIGATNGILTGLKNGTIKVIATSLDGSVSNTYDMEITDAEFLPVITAVSTTPASSMVFSIDFNPNDTIANLDASMIQLSGSSNPTTLKLSGSFPKFTVNVLGMTEDGDLNLTIPENSIKLKYDENYGNKKAVGTMQYNRYFPGTTGLTFAYFNGGNLAETVNLEKERFVIDPENPFLASIPFDETKAVFENTTGGAAFKGGLSVNHSDGEKKAGIEQITNYATPSLRGVNEGSRYASFAFDNCGNSDATTSAAYQDVIASFIWTNDQFVNGFSGSKIALDDQSTMRLNVNEVMGNYRFSSIHFLIKNGSQYYISQDSVRNAGMFALTDFNNSAEKLWLEYDPTTLDLPGDWSGAKSVDFDDVQAVGFIYKTSHQYHKTFKFDFFSVDGIKAEAPVVTFDVKGKSGLDRETPIVATSDVTMKKAGSLDAITADDIPSLFTLKKGNSEGEDIAFTGSIDDAAKVITITPSSALEFNTTYYVALKNEVVANVLGYATLLTEATFMTVADTTALVNEIAAAQTKYDNATEGSNEGQYDPGSKEMLGNAIATAQSIVDNAASKSQEEINLAKESLSKTVALFDLAQVNSMEILFYEDFGSNQYHKAEAANATNELEKNREHYIAEKVFIQGHNGSAETMGWDGASEGATLCFNINEGDESDSYSVFNIQKINTSNTPNAKIRLASIWYWGPITTSYSTDQGANWTALTRPTEPDWQEDGSFWQLYTYEESLPQCEDLWIKIEKDDKTSGTTQVDDITIFAPKSGNAPTVSFNVENNATNVDVAAQFSATSETELYKALDLSTITDASSFFVLKEGSKDGTDVTFAASLDATRKLFTISPAEKLKPNTNYYLALKNRVVADIDGNRVALTETNFTTGCDTLTLYSWISSAEAILATAEEGERNGDYIAGSKAILQEAIDFAISIMRDPEATQPIIDEQVTTIEAAIVTFQGSIVEVNYDDLDKSIKKGNDKMREDEYSSYPENARTAFESALDDAKSMRDNYQATQAEVDAAKEALDQAYDELILSNIDGANMDNVFIYPNPASDYIRINGISEASIRIIGANGAILYSQDNYNGESIDITSFAAGTYFLEVNENTISFIKK